MEPQKITERTHRVIASIILQDVDYKQYGGCDSPYSMIVYMADEIGLFLWHRHRLHVNDKEDLEKVWGWVTEEFQFHKILETRFPKLDCTNRKTQYQGTKKCSLIKFHQ